MHAAPIASDGVAKEPILFAKNHVQKLYNPKFSNADRLVVYTIEESDEHAISGIYLKDYSESIVALQMATKLIGQRFKNSTAPKDMRPIQRKESEDRRRRASNQVTA